MHLLHVVTALSTFAISCSHALAFPHIAQLASFNREGKGPIPAGMPAGCRWGLDSWGLHANTMSAVGPAGQNMVNVCWVNGTGTGESDSLRFQKRDAEVVKCLLHLHTKSPAICIGVKNSVCDIDHYTDTHGPVNNVRISTPYVHFGPDTERLSVEHARIAAKVMDDLIMKTMPNDSNQVVLIARNVSKASYAWRELHVNFNGGRLRC